MAENDHSMSTTRIESLADNVFSVAMTLLVVNLTIPEALRLSDMELHELLIRQSHKIYNYFMSFMLLAVLWVAHHRQSHFIRKTDHIHLWINMLILMFVVLMPFSTTLIGDYGSTPTARAFFSGNMLVLALLFQLNWIYATRQHRLVRPDLEEHAIRMGTVRCTAFLSVAAASLFCAYFIPTWSHNIYILLPVILSAKPFKS
ncbi:MAG TPA: TMEM175 family protein [Deltaproteobacteria bacterium]|nr:TMEM175 family protein [Deltaproteobacteria bacterium]